MKPILKWYLILGLIHMGLGGLWGQAIPLVSEPSWEAVNQSVGAPLLSDDSFWDDDAADLAKRMKVPPESETKTLASYRDYPEGNRTFLGGRVYSLAVYARGGKPESISIAFSNMGDVNMQSLEDAYITEETKVSVRKSAQELFERRLQGDEKNVTEHLTALLGQGQKTKFSSAGAQRQRVQRWNWKDLAFLLTVEEGRYIFLQIVPKALADTDGANERTKDQRLQLKENVLKRDNGDVLVTQIPMINQGQKGFCVPATFERILRYMGIRADMYILAMAGKTGLGGGTSVNLLVSNLYQSASKAGRRVVSVGLSPEPHTVEKYIDAGLPIVWTIYVDKSFYLRPDSILAERNEKRKGMTNPKEWTAALRKEIRKNPAIDRDPQNGHACMIIGYNKETDEIAFSDSWGVEFAERWMTSGEAKQITQGPPQAITW